MSQHGITSMEHAHATTIVAVHKDGKAAMAGDGQVSVGQTIMKHTARKVRFMSDNRVLGGFSGSVADAFTLFEMFEAKLDQYKHSMPRAAMEFAKQWRADKYLRRLEALLVVSDKEDMLVISGGGEVIEPDNKVAGIGSGGSYALAAARALIEHTDMSAEEIAREAIRIAADICVYTNHNITVETID